MTTGAFAVWMSQHACACADQRDIHPSATPRKRNTFNTAAKAIRLWPTAVLKGKELSEGPRKVKGVGASCAKLIDEFIKTGKIEPK